jgi:hypothetical protein
MTIKTMQKFRMPISAFLLLLFLFPFVQKGIHDLKHSKDFHCYVLNAKHFHKKEHVCSICDFTFVDSNTPLENNHNITLFACIAFYSKVTVSFILVDADYKFSPRAPPKLLTLLCV